MINLNKILVITSFLLIGLLPEAKSQQLQNPVIDSLKQEIIGFWVLENSIDTKIKFENDGTIKYYFNNVLQDTANYEIGTMCDGENQGNGVYFLRQYPNQGGVNCSYIESLNYNNDDRLVLMTKSQGKIIVYERP